MTTPADHSFYFDPSPWDQNEHGIWCPACGEIIAAPWNIGLDYEPPETCKTCGFPDFEDGCGYFDGNQP